MELGLLNIVLFMWPKLKCINIILIIKSKTELQKNIVENQYKLIFESGPLPQSRKKIKA